MTWDDGTPMSTHTDFYWRTGQPSIFLKDFARSARNQQSAASAVQTARINFSVQIATRDESDKTNAIRNSA